MRFFGATVRGSFTLVHHSLLTPSPLPSPPMMFGTAASDTPAMTLIVVFHSIFLYLVISKHIIALFGMHVAEVEDGREWCEERGDVGDAVKTLVEALDDVGDEGRVGDRSADFSQGVSRRLLEAEVLGNGTILLLDIAESLIEVNLAGLLVVVEEAVDSHPDHVRSGGGGVGRGRHDEVDDVHGHGTVEPAEDRGVKLEPRGIGWGRRGAEVIFEGVCGDGDVEEGSPLGEDVGLEVEDDRDEGADALDGGGLHSEVGVRMGRGGFRRRHGEMGVGGG